MRDHVTAYLSRGFSLVPVRTGSKEPAVPWSEFTERRASSDELSVSFAQTRAENIGIITGSVSGIVVLDVDGTEGEETIASLGGIPLTPTVKAARGCHYYFKHPGAAYKVRNFAGRLSGLDLRADGGLVVAPPSVHPTGIKYEWVVSFDDTPPADLPAWLLEYVDMIDLNAATEITLGFNFGADSDRNTNTSAYGLASLQDECDALSKAPPGQRNDLLNIAACKMANLIAGGQLSEAEAFDALLRASIENGLLTDDGKQQIEATIRSGFQRDSVIPERRDSAVDDDRDGEHPTIWLETVINDDEIPSCALQGIQKQFPKHNHNPSERFWKGLHQITKVVEGMACRLHEHPQIEAICPDWSDSFFVSFLPCGVGKTTALIESVKAILEMRQYDHVSFVIFLSRLEEIKAIVERMGLETETFAVITSNDNYNRMGNANKKQARVLFTTQQMLERRAKSEGRFSDITDFHFRGQPRQVRVWDEAILPSRILTLERRRIWRLIDGLYKLAPDLSREVEELAERLKAIGDGSLIEIPDIEKYAVTLSEARLAFADDDKDAIEALYGIQGRVVRVKKDNYGTTTLQYQDILPDDLAPMLILDASGQQRKTYQLWATGRKGTEVSV